MPLTQPYSPHTPSTMRTSRGEVPVPERMSLADFKKLDWPETDRWELIEGVPCMTPSGTFDHQDLSTTLLLYLSRHLGDAGYRVVSDVDIDFPASESYLRPDISVFPPDRIPDGSALPVKELPVLVVELLSPSTASIDVGPKLAIYDRAGVDEYWVADPATGALMIWFRDDKQSSYKQATADPEGRVSSRLLGAALRIVREPNRFRVTG
jgi:Uma2 family endonuclease